MTNFEIREWNTGVESGFEVVDATGDPVILISDDFETREDAEWFLEYLWRTGVQPGEGEL